MLDHIEMRPLTFNFFKVKGQIHINFVRSFSHFIFQCQNWNEEKNILILLSLFKKFNWFFNFYMDSKSKIYQYGKM